MRIKQIEYGRWYEYYEGNDKAKKQLIQLPLIGWVTIHYIFKSKTCYVDVNDHIQSLFEHTGPNAIDICKKKLQEHFEQKLEKVCIEWIESIG